MNGFRSRSIGRALALALVLSCALVAWPACKSGDTDRKLVADDSGKVPLTLQLNWVPEPEFGGFYHAVQAGMYEQEGLSVTISAGAAGVQTWRAVATGKVPLAIASAGEVLRHDLKGADLVAIYSVYQKNPMALMVHEDSGVSSLEDIFKSGKIGRVAMEADMPYGKFLRDKYGFDRVKLLQHGNNLSLFLQDKTMAQQCFIFSEPVSARQQGVPVRAFSIGESGYNPYQAVVIVHRDLLRNNREVFERFVHATRAGWQGYLDDPEPANKYMRTQGATMEMPAMKLAAELQSPYIADRETGRHGLGYMSKERWQTLADQLVSLGDLSSAPDVGQAFAHIPPR